MVLTWVAGVPNSWQEPMWSSSKVISSGGRESRYYERGALVEAAAPPGEPDNTEAEERQERGGVVELDRATQEIQPHTSRSITGKRKSSSGV